MMNPSISFETDQPTLSMISTFCFSGVEPKKIEKNKHDTGRVWDGMVSEINVRWWQLDKVLKCCVSCCQPARRRL